MPFRATRPVLIRPLRDFLATESAGGIAVVGAALLALVWANSPWQGSYRQLWATVLELRLGSLSLTLDLRQFVNEALMTIFFLVVGLEIKREIVEGELREPSRRALPVFAAIGGMIIPALIYAGINFGGPEVQGWGIPMATDIALAVGVMTLAGNVMPALKLFLLALAIVDDIGAILVIGVFYAGQIELGWIAAAGAVVAVVVVMQMRRVEVLWVYVFAGCGLWVALHQAGIHATLSGVILGLLAPTKPYLAPELIDQNELTNIGSAQDVLVTTKLARSAVSVVEWLEHRLHPWTSFLIVPIFALANAGISLSTEGLRAAVISPVTIGVFLGLVIGKPLGILAASAVAVRLGAASLPVGVTWAGIGGASLLAGLGFTVSLFIAEVALGSSDADHARLGILAASIAAGTIGLLVLRRVGRSGQSNSAST